MQGTQAVDSKRIFFEKDSWHKAYKKGNMLVVSRRVLMKSILKFRGYRSIFIEPVSAYGNCIWYAFWQTFHKSFGLARKTVKWNITLPELLFRDSEVLEESGIRGFLNSCECKLSHLKGCFDGHRAPRDPFNMPELQHLLSNQKRAYRGKIEKKARSKQRKTALQDRERTVGGISSRSHEMSLRPSRFGTRHLRIPSEILWLIVDHLPGSRDMQVLMLVLPQKSWRDRCIKGFLLAEPLPADDEMDWHYLHFQTDKLLSRSHGWLYRKHVIKRRWESN